MDLFDDTYKTIVAESHGDFRDRGSKFMGFAFPVKNDADIKQLIKKIKKDHPKANHHCYAFRLGAEKNNFRFSDDREPSSSAGKPIYGVIQSNDLTDILIVVVRYFGGTLLGVPGLINAYRSAAESAVNNATINTLTVNETYKVICTYENLNSVLSLIKKENGIITEQQLGEKCNLEFEIRRRDSDKLISKIRELKNVEVTN